ncbi:putative transcriptional activator (PerC family) from phage origin [Escherichia coli]|uniref:Putative transcriptional activator (PerC family) from phage origin n=1 Tax=Escherichia coli TaxID=562 RepID=A0A376J9H7_ECOLX|nr:putative transcriptional activator (PerC family) from phage origin [Escherichia coli]
MVHDRIAEELEAKGFYRRAAARWGEVMQLVETDKERHQVTMRRLECSRKAQRPPEPPTENYADLRNAVNRTYADMGAEQISRVGIPEPHHTAGAIRLFCAQKKPDKVRVN